MENEKRVSSKHLSRNHAQSDDGEAAATGLDTSGSGRLSAHHFYAEYHGHRLAHLSRCHAHLRASGRSSFIFLLGDSSLDNKHWLFPNARKLVATSNDTFCGDAVNGWQEVLNPARMVKDVSYHMNDLAARRGEHYCTMNCAVEESTLADRSASLLPQDEFVRDNLTEHDTLCVSVGGNDIALRPSVSTIAHMATLLTCSSVTRLNSCTYNSLPPGLAHFVHMFGARVAAYIERIVARCKPRRVLVCMIYYLDQRAGGSWADRVLSLLGYNRNPAKLQAVIRKVFEFATARIRIAGTDVVAVPLFETLDGRDSSDYEQRVEPSVTGGRKMAATLLDAVIQPLATATSYK